MGSGILRHYRNDHLAACRRCSGIAHSGDGPMMGWVNTMAYAMVSAVLLLILVYPTGVLATTGIDHRLIGLGAGLLAMFISKRLIF